jgi:hypothetical protein
MTLNGLPRELLDGLMAFLTETDGRIEVADMGGLLRFVAEHGESYPALLDLIEVNGQAIVERFERTGEVPPGVKMIGTAREGNVTRLSILTGPVPPKKDRV